MVEAGQKVLTRKMMVMIVTKTDGVKLNGDCLVVGNSMLVTQFPKGENT